MTRDSFVFYRSFMEAAQSLSNRERLKFYDSLVEFALNGEANEISGPAAGLLILIKPVLETNNRKYENGKKGAEFGALGGRPPKNPKETPKKPQGNPNKTPYVEEDVEEDVEDDVKEEEDGSAFVLADGSAYFPPVGKIQEYEKAFPGVDVHRELLRCMIKHNAMDRRKNVTNIERYIVNWLINAQSDAKKKPPGFSDIEQHNTPVDGKFWSDLGERNGNLI